MTILGNNQEERVKFNFELDWLTTLLASKYQVSTPSHQPEHRVRRSHQKGCLRSLQLWGQEGQICWEALSAYKTVLALNCTLEGLVSFSKLLENHLCLKDSAEQSPNLPSVLSLPIGIQKTSKCWEPPRFSCYKGKMKLSYGQKTGKRRKVSNNFYETCNINNPQLQV